MFTPCIHTSIDAYSNLVTWVSVKDVHGALQSVRLKELRFIRVSPCPGDSKALHLAFELDNPPRTKNAVIHLDDFKSLEDAFKSFTKEYIFYSHKLVYGTYGILSSRPTKDTIQPTAAVTDGYLMVFTSTGMRKIKVRSIQSIVAGEKEVSIIYYDAGEVAYMPFPTECYPSIVNALKEYAESLKKGSK